ncbi:uncharacterized protein GIQ15_05774 [Arthroderma uncinatum]|uniref:uncharacterized protein n=1 Tax=Arthroderma uncinatum TaxID=74035 RepID=UPI00144AA311|nr:uncharacterized protein GIQ15_05774 [Arthroderma uncinatum]KAF3480427.1 hypothetical protein GIQ15_05774 [Arthroderma uncinatum]
MRVIYPILPFALFGIASVEPLNDPQISNDANGTDPKVAADVFSITSLFNFEEWRSQGNNIRLGNRVQCFTKLSMALSNVGPIYQAGTAGSAGALSLLPTAGALIGAPAKELWILYKIMPLAGVFAMMLSLGGNIVPDLSSDYEQDGFTYGGWIATTSNGDLHEPVKPIPMNETNATTFADMVEARAHDPLGNSKRLLTAFGMFCQLFWIGIIIFACWFTGIGGIVSWWCSFSGWMLGWYMVVALSSLFANFAGIPFTRQWTIRVSKAPGSIRISDDAPALFPLEKTTADTQGEGSEVVAKAKQAMRPLWSVTHQDSHDTSSTAATMEDPKLFQRPPLITRQSRLLDNLGRHGFNTVGYVTMDPSQPFAVPRQAFMVIISVSGTSHGHAALRVISKAISVGVFAAGTATFASSTLITISVALTTLCLVLGAGIFGRVASMWIASQLMKEHPVLHRVVHTEDDAEKFIYHILTKQGLTCELLGHVFINGRCVRRYSRWFNWSNVFGILAPPYSIEKLISKY